MKFIFTAIMLFASLNSNASGLYVIGEYGQSNFTSLNPESFKVAVGYGLTDHLGVELGAEDLGRASVKTAVASDFASAKAASLVFVGSAIIPNYGHEDHAFSVFYKLGMARVSASTSGTAGPIPGFTALGTPILSTSKISVTYGLGASYQLDTNWFIRLDGDVYKSGHEAIGNISVFSAGVVYKF